MATTPTSLPAGASLSDMLTAVKNLVTAVNNASDIYKSVNGKSTLEGITVPTVVKASPGRVASVSIINAGSAPGMLYDAVTLTDFSAPLWPIPDAAATVPYVVNLPTDSGLLVVPGTGQNVTVSWS